MNSGIAWALAVALIFWSIAYADGQREQTERTYIQNGYTKNCQKFVGCIWVKP